jgi:hypothetical protein
VAAPCPECGLDVEQLDATGAADRIGGLGPRYRAAFEGVDDGDARVRARADAVTWSPLEYAAHVRDVIRYHGWLANLALTEERPEVPVPDPDAVASGERYNDAQLDEVLDAIEHQSARFATRARGLNASDVQRVAIRGGDEVTVLHMVRNVAHEGHHHGQDVERLLARS